MQITHEIIDCIPVLEAIDEGRTFEPIERCGQRIRAAYAAELLQPAEPVPVLTQKGLGFLKQLREGFRPTVSR